MGTMKDYANLKMAVRKFKTFPAILANDRNVPAHRVEFVMLL
jgi:hypothetical protein